MDDDNGTNTDKTDNPCTLISNPLDLDEIFNIILDYVGGHKKSLLNCRLVNRRLNSLVLSKLRKEDNCFISLNPLNILQYVKLNKKSKQTSPSLPISLTLQQYLDDHQENHDKFIAGIKKLIKLFGPTCIDQIQISTGKVKTTFDWTKILSRRRNTYLTELKHLHINQGDRKTLHNSFWLVKRQLISFPSLQSFSYSGISQSPEHFGLLINSASNLQSLNLDLTPRGVSNIDGRRTEIVNQLMANSIRAITSSTLAQLIELKIVLSNELTFQALSSHQFPALKKLTVCFTKKISLVSGNILNSFLTNNCPALSSLHFSFHYNKFELYDVLLTHDGVHGGFPAGFPTLPNIVHFEVSYIEEPKSLDSGSPSAFIQIDHLTSNNFPNLNSVTIMYGTHFYYSPAFIGYDPFSLDEQGQLVFQWVNNPRVLNHVCFEKVGSLTLIVDHRVSTSDFGQFASLLPTMWMNSAVNQLHLLFPNIKALCIDNQIRPDEDSLAQLKYLIVKCLGEIPNLEKLTMTNYVQDIFNEFPLPPIQEQHYDVLQLESLKSLTLPPIQKYYKQIMESRGKSIGYEIPITHGTVTINGLPLIASPSASSSSPPNDDDTTTIDNSNFGQYIIDVISSQLRWLTTSTTIDVINVVIEPIYSTDTATYYEDLALIGKCLELIIFVEKSSVVGALASHLLVQLKNVNASRNKSRILQRLNPSLNINALLDYAPELEELHLGEEFLSNDTSSSTSLDLVSIAEVMEDFKTTNPQLKIKLL